MRIEDIMQLDTFEKKLSKLKEGAKETNKEKWQKEYDGEHSILTDIDRKTEIVGTDNNQRIVKKAKEIITFQKKITNMAVQFLFGEPAELILNNKEKANISSTNRDESIECIKANNMDDISISEMVADWQAMC